MSIAEPPRPDFQDPTQLTVVYTPNPDGWVTAQITEYPSAISQGATQHEAWTNVLDAFHDLTHEPTATERAIYNVQAQLDRVRELVEDLGPIVERTKRSAADAVERLGRQRVH